MDDGTITKAEVIAVIRLRLNAAKETRDEWSMDEQSQVIYSNAQIAAYEELIERFSRH